MPARFRDIKRVLAGYGISAEPPSSGSHWKLRHPSGKMYTLPCPNAERSEVSDVYLRAMCRNLGLEFAEFMSRL